MRERVAAWFVVAAIVATTACGALLGARDPVEVAADGGALDDGASGADGPAATVSPETACGDLYDGLAAYLVCTGFTYPWNINGHRERFVKVCAMQLAAPGARAAASAVETCAAGLHAAAPTCAPVDAACVAPAGALPSGSACGTGLQCASRFCNAGQGTPQSYVAPTLLDLLPQSLGACGVCADKLPIGASCNPGTGPSTTVPPCVDGAYCANLGPPGPSPTGPYVCQGVPPGGDVGAACSVAVTGGAGGAEPFPCKSGLTCSSPTSGTCQPPSDLGGPCGPLTCKGQLVCAYASGAAMGTCVVGKGLGETCSLDDTAPCARLLTCSPTTTPTKCHTVTFEPPGGTCDYSASPCATGFCQNLTGSPAVGVCPPVTADGQPCTTGPTPVCDDFATCGPVNYGPPPMPDGGGGGGGGGSGGGPGSPDAGSPPDAYAGPVCVLFDPGSCR
jgi:hypothetical protein